MSQSEPRVWMFSYFRHPGRDGLRLAYSQDVLHWEAVAGGRGLLEPKLGEQVMRDPYIHPGVDGRYHLIWTVGWAGRSIGYAVSEDMIHWSEQREIPVMGHEPEAINCWAPEMLWDEAKRHYFIYWSTTIPGRYPETDGQNGRNHRLYYTTTPDCETFGETRLLFNQGFNVIDADILKHGDGYLMCVKNETNVPFPVEKNIRVTTAPAPEGPWAPVSAPITGNYWAEGPCAIHLDGAVVVFFDKYREGAYGAVRSRDLKTWSDISEGLSFPPEARHGHLFQVPASALEKLLRHHG